MIDSLYEPFKKWSATGSIYIISDPHFEDSDCQLMDPNWPTPQDYINNIKKQVHKNDTLICLGDVGNPEWFGQLNCYKVLIMGNHDKGRSNYERKNIFYKKYDSLIELDEAHCKKEVDNCEIGPRGQLWGFKDNRLFDEVYEGPLLISPHIMLSHEPCGSPFWCNLHGHCHNGEFFEEIGGYNFAANVVEFNVLSLGEMIKKGLIKKQTYIDIHRLTIDVASNKK